MKKILIGICTLGLLAGCSSNNTASGTVQQKTEQQKQETTSQPAVTQTSQPSRSQPTSNKPVANKPVTTSQCAKKQTASKTATPTQPIKTPSSILAVHDNAADIAHDVVVLKSKTAIAVSNEKGWVPIINVVPDATVPDGFGGMLYAWNVTMNGGGDGSAQQIYFFDNNRYLGKDTKDIHLQSTVHPESTGTIIATYGHFLPNDASCCPTGEPYIVTFHWNGTNIIPDSVSTLNEAVNDQFK